MTKRAGKKHSRETIVQVLKNLARQLGKDTLSKKEVGANLPLSSVNSYFGSLGNALVAAGLKRTDSAKHLRGPGVLITDEELFRSLRRVETDLEHEPGANEYSAYGQYSVKPFRERFGKWADIISRYRIWKLDHPLQALQPDARPAGQENVRAAVAAPRPELSRAAGDAGREDGLGPRHSAGSLYGQEINFRSLRHAAANELEVIFLFGIVSQELGFSVERVRAGYPDCEAKCRARKGDTRLRKVFIEFEFKSSNFREHAHDPAQCDYVICWENDWPQCPVPVIELRKEIMKLPH